MQNTLNAAQAMAADAQSMQVASAQMAQALQSWAEELKNSQTKRTEEAAMLIRLDFYQNSFLKKDCAQQVTAPATSMNYTI